MESDGGTRPPERGPDRQADPADAPDDGDGGLTRRRLLLLGGVATVGLFAVSRGRFVGEDHEREVRLVVNLHGHTLETGDLEGHLETLHPDAPIYNETEMRARDTIRNHNVTVSVTVESIAVDNRTAEADVVRTTRGEDDYRPRREWLTYRLRRYEGEWRIYNRTVQDSENPDATGG